MSTSEPQERELSQGEELVAYLDGELPPDVTRQVEERLARDADYLQQLRELDQAWEALDVLPRTVADDDFARTTIEMVAQKAQVDLSQRVAEVAQVERRNHLRWVFAALLVAVASFTIASMALPDEDDRLLENLPAIRQVDLLTQISDIAFLRELANRVPESHLIRYDETFNRELTAIIAASAPTAAERKRWVQNLLPEEQQNLYAQQERFFLERPTVEQQRLKAFHQEIAQDPDSEKLQRVLVAYGQWLIGKRETLKEELRDQAVPAATRVGRIAQLAEEDVTRRARSLNEEERRKLQAEVRKIAFDHKSSAITFFNDLPPGNERDRAEREQAKKEVLQRLEAEGPAAELLIVTWALTNEETDEATRDRLVAQLDPETKSVLLSRDGRPNNRAQELLGFWIMESTPLRQGIDSDELRRFFANKLTREQQQRLLESPTSEFESQVERQLYDQQNGLRAMNRLMGRGGRGGGGGGGGGNRGRNEEDGPPRGGRGRRGGPPGTEFDGGPGGFGGERRGPGDPPFGPGRRGRGFPPDDGGKGDQ